MLLLLAGLALPALAGKLIKWVDDQGQVHYGDKIPVEYAAQQHSVLNKQGVTLKRSEDAVRTREEAEEKKRQEQLQAEQKQQAQEQAKEQAAKDKRLQDSYASEQDIIKIRDRQLAGLEEEIKNSLVNQEKLKARLAELNTKSNALQAANKPVPAKLQDDIKTTQTQETQYDALIQAKRKEQDLVRKTAEEDLRQYQQMQARAQVP
ncbi:MAG: DUF4124 domain-containing protein [Gammaproteobacteria bacterium]|nr:DUF4124 domain-containing protein [Gammaproteobacteria bacterium]